MNIYEVKGYSPPIPFKLLKPPIQLVQRIDLFCCCCFINRLLCCKGHFQSCFLLCFMLLIYLFMLWPVLFVYFINYTLY